MCIPQRIKRSKLKRFDKNCLTFKSQNQTLQLQQSEIKLKLKHKNILLSKHLTIQKSIYTALEKEITQHNLSIKAFKNQDKILIILVLIRIKTNYRFGIESLSISKNRIED